MTKLELRSVTRVLGDGLVERRQIQKTISHQKRHRDQWRDRIKIGQQDPRLGNQERHHNRSSRLRILA